MLNTNIDTTYFSFYEKYGLVSLYHDLEIIYGEKFLLTEKILKSEIIVDVINNYLKKFRFDIPTHDGEKYIYRYCGDKIFIDKTYRTNKGNANLGKYLSPHIITTDIDAGDLYKISTDLISNLKTQKFKNLELTGACSPFTTCNHNLYTPDYIKVPWINVLFNLIASITDKKMCFRDSDNNNTAIFPDFDLNMLYDYINYISSNIITNSLYFNSTNCIFDKSLKPRAPKLLEGNFNNFFKIKYQKDKNKLKLNKYTDKFKILNAQLQIANCDFQIDNCDWYIVNKSHIDNIKLNNDVFNILNNYYSDFYDFCRNLFPKNIGEFEDKLFFFLLNFNKISLNNILNNIKTNIEIKNNNKLINTFMQNLNPKISDQHGQIKLLANNIKTAFYNISKNKYEKSYRKDTLDKYEYINNNKYKLKSEFRSKISTSNNIYRILEYISILSNKYKMDILSDDFDMCIYNNLTDEELDDFKLILKIYLFTEEKHYKKENKLTNNITENNFDV